MAAQKFYKPTRGGDALALDLAAHIGMTPDIRSTCAALVRAANRWAAMELVGCNGSRFRDQCTPTMPKDIRDYLDRRAAQEEADADAESDRLMPIISDLVSRLPEHDQGPWQVEFGSLAAWVVGPNGTRIDASRGRVW
jgi:hypothetical protein